MEFAEKLRMTHKQEHPDYKYQPRRKKARTQLTAGNAGVLQVNATTTMMQALNGGNVGKLATTTGTTTTNINGSVELKSAPLRRTTANATGSRGKNLKQQQPSDKIFNNSYTNNNNNNKNSSSNNNNNNNNNLVSAQDVLSNEAFLKTLNSACAASLMDTQSVDDNVDYVGEVQQRRFEYARRMDSPCSTTSSLPSTTGNEGQPLTPPATPFTHAGSSSSLLSASLSGKRTPTQDAGQHNLLLRQLSAASAEYGMLIEASSGRDYTALDGGVGDSQQYNATTTNVELLEFPRTQTDLLLADELSYTPTNGSTQYTHIQRTNYETLDVTSNFKHYHSYQQHQQSTAAYLVYNENNHNGESCAASTPSPHAIGALNYLQSSGGDAVKPSTNATQMLHSYLAPMPTVVGGSSDIDPKEIDQYLMQHQVLSMTHNNSNQQQPHTPLLPSTETTASSTVGNSTKSSLQLPYKTQQQHHMLELQPVDAALAAQHLLSLDATSAAVTASTSNGSSCFYAPTSSSASTSSANTLPTLGYQHYAQQNHQQQQHHSQHQQHENQQNSNNHPHHHMWSSFGNS